MQGEISSKPPQRVPSTIFDEATRLHNQVFPEMTPLRPKQGPFSIVRTGLYLAFTFTVIYGLYKIFQRVFPSSRKSYLDWSRITQSNPSDLNPIISPNK